MGLLGATLILIFLTLEETGWDRTPGAENVALSDNFLKNRIQTFLPGNKAVGTVPITQVVRYPTPSPISPTSKKLNHVLTPPNS